MVPCSIVFLKFLPHLFVYLVFVFPAEKTAQFSDTPRTVSGTCLGKAFKEHALKRCVHADTGENKCCREAVPVGRCVQLCPDGVIVALSALESHPLEWTSVPYLQPQHFGG